MPAPSLCHDDGDHNPASRVRHRLGGPGGFSDPPREAIQPGSSPAEAGEEPARADWVVAASSAETRLSHFASVERGVPLVALSTPSRVQAWRAAMVARTGS